ncbi:MAG: hypothetical protein H8E22_03830, partial [Candidatus Cloacimonetes bacterium]|nr:hypothetical protein [Candidatus Cloacimonadota bacterium]
HYAFFDVPALDGSIDMITYEFGDTLVEGGGDEGEEEEEEEGVTIPALDMVFANGAITLTGSASINGTTGTNSTVANSVNFAWSTIIDGDFYVGPGADYTSVIHCDGWGRVPEDNITGTISNLPSTRTYPLPTYPDFPELTDRGSFSTPWTPSGEYLIDDDGYYSSISATSSRTITIDVGSGTRRIVVGSLSVGQGYIELLGTGNLIFYVENSFSLTGSSIINTGGDASKVHMYYSGAADLNFAGSTEYNGSVYLETASVRIGGSGGITGHIICGGSSVDVNGAANAYVRALYAPNADASITGSGSISGILVANTITITGSGSITANTGWTDPIPDIDDSGDDSPSGSASYLVQVDITALVSEDEYGNETDHTSFATVLFSYSGGESEEEEETPALSMEADLHINPTNNSSNRFQMQTPSGQIDRGTLLSGGSSYTYSGSATEIRLRCKNDGRILTVNGSDITLATSTAYTITSDSMTVNLRNSHGPGNAMDHWWIEITCSDPTVSPDPGLPEPEEEEPEEETGEITLEDIEILYWKP